MNTVLLDKLDEDLYGMDPINLRDKLRRNDSFRVILTDKQRLPNLYKTCLCYKQNYVFLCQSPMDSGKTFQLNKIVRYFKRSSFVSRREFRALIITPKRTFASYIVKKIPGFVDYRKCRKPYSYVDHPRFVVQVQSLKHFRDIDTDTYSVKGYALVIMDEVHSILEELFSDLFTRDERRNCIDRFIKVLRAIPRWVCFDAHISLDIVKILSAIDGDCSIEKSHIFMINKYRMPDYKLIFYRKCCYQSLVMSMLRRKLCSSEEFCKYKALLCTQKLQTLVSTQKDKVLNLFTRIYIRDMLGDNNNDDILVPLYDSLRRGERICATTSTKRHAELLAHLFRKCGFKVSLITGDSSEETKRRFTNNPDKFVSKCQLFVYTTAFQVGINVSSYSPYFSEHYIFLECSTRAASPGAFVQTIGRVRKLKCKTYRIVVLNHKKRKLGKTLVPPLTMGDMLPLRRDAILPLTNKNKKIVNMMVDFFFKEKSIAKHSELYVSILIRLMSRKAKPFAMIEGNVRSVEDMVNFDSFHFSYDNYDGMVNSFIGTYNEEVSNILEKYVGSIWKKLETSSIYVSTLINNYHAFVRLPDGVDRSECLLKICEFTTYPFGFLWSYVLSSRLVESNYFERQLMVFYPKASMTDLQQLKVLFGNLASCCTRTATGIWPMRRDKYLSLLNVRRREIVSGYIQFVSVMVSETASIDDVFVKLMSKTLRVYVRNRQDRHSSVDLSELRYYMQMIDIDEWVRYNDLATSAGIDR